MPAELAQTATPNASDASDEFVLRVDELAKTFVTRKRRVRALDGVTLQAGRGAVTGLIGPDGAGKTTLIRLLAGLLEPDSGAATVLGMDATRESLGVQAAVGYMPQHFGLYEDLSVRENLDLYADLQGVLRADRAARYETLMHMTGLGDFQDRLAGRLSGGMKQKLGLACTLVRSPRLLMLDEPTVGVDPVSRRELWEIVYRLVRDESVSVLLSTAYLDEAQRCDAVVMMYQGRVLDRGRPEAFSRRLAGRTFVVDAPGLKTRHAQARLAACDDVVDAVIDRGRLRIVTARPGRPEAARLLPDVPGASVAATEPNIEDTFVDTLLRESHAEHAGAADVPPRDHAPPARDEPVIEVRHVQRWFGQFCAVKGVTFAVRRGEIFGLLGANGAGKSTTFRMLCGLLPATKGTLRVAGMDLRTAPAAARGRIGYMAQKFSLYGILSVRQNLRFAAGVYGLRGARRAGRVQWMLDHFDLARHAGAASGELPVGYKQRLAMACATMHDPDVLFLDEPTSGVDPLARRQFWARISALADQGVTVMVTTHFLAEAEYCDRIAVMARGEILDIGTPSELRALARTDDHPDPTMEEAFIYLIQRTRREEQAP